MSSRRPNLGHGLKIIITGASGGIGSALAKCAGQHGASLGLMGRNTHQLNRIAQELTRDGVCVSVYIGDLGDLNYVSHSIHSFSTQMGGIDVVIHAAGVGLRDRYYSNRTEEELELLNINMTASISLLKTVIPIFDTGGWGHFVNLSALGAYYWAPFQSAYVASKAGFLAYCTSLNYELRQKNIYISNVILPGVDTPFTDHPNYEVYRRQGKLLLPETVAAKVVKGLLVPRQNLVVGSKIGYWISRISMFAPYLFQSIIEKRNPPPKG